MMIRKSHDKFIKRSQLGLVLLALFAFFPVSWITSFSGLIDVLNAVAVAIGAGVILAYGRGLCDGIRRDHLTPGHLLVIGIILSWIAVIVRLVWSWIWRLSGEPAWMLDHWAMSFAVWVFIMGGALHLTAQNAIEYHIPRSNWIWLGVMAVCGVLLGLLLLSLGLVPLTRAATAAG